jgi:RNA polymerase sigma-70 factor (ECF subfamily)
VVRAALDPKAAPPKPDSDESALVSLAALAAAGDDIATQKVLRAVSPVMGKVIGGVLGGSHPEVDDVLQQSLIALLRALPAFRGECHPAGYASRIALHTALRARKRAGFRLHRVQELARLSPEDPHSSPSEDADSERRKRLLRDLLADLPDEQAEALALRIMLGWTLDEVAVATGAPMNTVRSRVRLAKEALRRRIEASPVLADELGVER